MRTTFCLAAALAAATCMTTVAFAQQSTGNGAQSGAHYDLNIIGVPHDKINMPALATGNVIFVDLNGTTKILLSPGPFQVLDKNGTDGQASYQLPAEDPTTGVFTQSYKVYARDLGKPGGQSSITTCASDPALSGTAAGSFCDTGNSVSFKRKKGTALAGNNTFTNVTTNLTTITITFDPLVNTALALCLTGQGITLTPDPTTGLVTVTLSLFNPCLENFLWSYDNHGLKLLQMRFYPT